MAKKNNFEDALNRLENITKEMENSEVTLEQAMKLYKQGVEEAIFCSKFLDNIEQEVKMLQKNSNGTFKLKKFESLEEY
ncbi:MAG: exodeoxyribonuclease VII small subunit [Eubacteriales bacterium]|nr:exodeoxyribonuclease VII small subunit [Eubacteriales bacterium]